MKERKGLARQFEGDSIWGWNIAYICILTSTFHFKMGRSSLTSHGCVQLSIQHDRGEQKRLRRHEESFYFFIFKSTMMPIKRIILMQHKKERMLWTSDEGNNSSREKLSPGPDSLWTWCGRRRKKGFLVIFYLFVRFVWASRQKNKSSNCFCVWQEEKIWCRLYSFRAACLLSFPLCLMVISYEPSIFMHCLKNLCYMLLSEGWNGPTFLLMFVMLRVSSFRLRFSCWLFLVDYWNIAFD